MCTCTCVNTHTLIHPVDRVYNLCGHGRGSHIRETHRPPDLNSTLLNELSIDPDKPGMLASFTISLIRVGFPLGGAIGGVPL